MVRRQSPRGGRLVDRFTQAWVRSTGRRVDLADHPWLDGPFGMPDRIGDEWVEREAERLGGVVAGGNGQAGLLASMNDLNSDTFDASSLRAEIRDFYESTTSWRLELWSQWSPVAWPFGWLMSTLFSSRLEQLSLPLRPLDVARGMDSRVVQVVGRDERQLGAAWVRTARSTGVTIYSGWYGVSRLPGSTQPSVRVAFPLPNGSVTVFLRPEVSKGGSLRLSSPLGKFGEEGAYLIVREPTNGFAFVRRAPIAERFDVYVDADGCLRTDHDLRLWNIPVIRLHYRLERRVPTARQPRSRTAPTTEELVLLAKDLNYEYAMAMFAASKLAELREPRGNDLEWSAWIEILLLHTRVLTDFLSQDPRGDDVAAEDFAAGWNRQDDDVEWLRLHTTMINKRVMHLTAYRQRVVGGTDAPPIGELIGHLQGAVRRFYEVLPPDRQAWFPSGTDEEGGGPDDGSGPEQPTHQAE